MNLSPATLLLAFDAVLIGTLLALALAAVLSPEPRRAVVLFIAFGLWLALVWARLRAPDVALAEAAIGAGIGGALMLAAARRAAANLSPRSRTRRRDLFTATTPDPDAGLSPAAARAARAARWIARLRETRDREPGER